MMTNEPQMSEAWQMYRVFTSSALGSKHRSERVDGTFFLLIQDLGEGKKR